MTEDLCGRIRDLTKMFATTDPEIRAYAVAMLGMTHSTMVLPVLRNALRDVEPAVRVAVVEALINTNTPDGRHMAISALHNSRPLLELASRRIRPAIISAVSLGMKDDSVEMRCDAAELVFRMQAQSAAVPLFEAMKLDALVRATFVIHIGEAHSEESESVLVGYLHDPEPEVRFFAVEGLRNFGGGLGNSARSAICELAGKEKDPQVIAMLSGVLRDIGYPAPPVSDAGQREKTLDSGIPWLLSRRLGRQMREGTILPDDDLGMPAPFKSRGATPDPKRGPLTQHPLRKI